MHRKLIGMLGGRRAIAFSMALLAACVAFAPVSGFFVLAIATYFVMGSARGVGGVAMNTNLMEMVPKHLMGRVQNAFYFCGTFLQLVLAVSVGAVAHRVSLVRRLRNPGVCLCYVVRRFELADRGRRG